ncbi:hypothetical protein K456DRAFT_1901412 [Colletotrichum gloeosporioides 23]|nr:hypothetical protein K456DRAFT_1901412 [Colletotrichum gloeosporioides 23]
MAEAFGLVASIFATVQIADRVISLCKRYIEGIRDAPSDLRTILVETSAVKAILENVKFLIECDNGHSAIFDSLSGASNPIEGCRETMKSLEALFRTETVTTQTLGRSRKLKGKALMTLAALAWPLKTSKAAKLLQDVATHKSTITLALTVDVTCGIRNIVERTTCIQKTLSDSEQREVFNWLQDTDPSPLHHLAQKNDEAGTCDWFGRIPEWSRFLNGSERCLWIHGIPGAGKTILASQLVKKIEEHCLESRSERVFSTYYYCYFGHNQDESIPFLRWVLNRLCRKAQKVSDHLWKLYEHGGIPSLAHLLTALELALDNFDAIYVTIDAIDESNPREDLLKIIRDLPTDPRFDKIRLLVTSREYLDIEKAMEDMSTSIPMRNTYLEADIRHYTWSRLVRESKFKDWSQELREETLEALTKGAKGMFRWVVCQIDSLRRIKGNADAIKYELKRLPKTLYEAYDRIFQQISTEDDFIVNLALKWICFDARFITGCHLTLDVLLEAVDWQLVVAKPRRYNALRDTETLRELCGCLISITPITTTNMSQRDLVSFSRYTVLEYLASSQRHLPDPFFSMEDSPLALEKAEYIFQRVLNINNDDTALGVESSRDGVSIFPTFAAYCIRQGLEIMFKFETILYENERLVNLTAGLIDDRKYHFSGIKVNSGSVLRVTAMLKWHWYVLPSVEIRILARFLLLQCYSLAEDWAKRINLRNALQTKSMYI